MALIPVHKRITEKVLKEFGFTDKAIAVAAQANADVDKKQGNEDAERNPHGMGGVVDHEMTTVPGDE